MAGRGGRARLVKPVRYFNCEELVKRSLAAEALLAIWWRNGLRIGLRLASDRQQKSPTSLEILICALACAFLAPWLALSWRSHPGAPRKPNSAAGIASKLPRGQPTPCLRPMSYGCDTRMMEGAEDDALY